MAAPSKTKKVFDIAKPDTIKPQASGRPIIVTNHTVLPNDPMVKPEVASEELPSAPALSRHGKTLLMPGVDDEAAAAKPTDGADETQKPAESNDKPLETAPEVKAVKEKKIEPLTLTAPDEEKTEAEPTNAGAEPKISTEETPPSTPAEASETAEGPELGDGEQRKLDAAEAAARKAEEDLEQLIESGAYSLPINRTARKRSRLITLVLLLLTLLLAAALVDLLLDVRLIHLSGAPHTTFFKNQ